MMSGYNNYQCGDVKYKLIETSNFINKGVQLIEVHGTCSYKLTMNQCVLLS